MPRTFAYCRVSTGDQTTENQLQEIRAAGFSIEKRRAVEETISGSTKASERPGFSMLVDRMEPGDVLIVTKLDRLGRNAMDVRSTVELLASRDIRVHCLALGGMDLTSAAGKMTMGVLNAVAEFERDLIIERTHAGLARAVEQGVTLGRKRAFSDEQAASVRARIASGETIADIARELNVSRRTIERINARATA